VSPTGAPSARRVMGLCMVSVLPGCTDFEPGTDELSASREMLGELPAAPGTDWSCLDTVPSRIDRATLGAPITYTVRLVDLGTRNPVSDMTVRVCGLTDVDCVMPVADALRPDADGRLDIPLTEGFAGYLELRSSTTVPSSFYLNEGLRTMTEFPFVAVTVATFEGLRAAVGVTADDSFGAIAVRTFDCQGVPAPSTVLTNNVGGVPFYFANGLPDITRRETDDDGLAGYVNSPPGVTLLQSQLTDGTVVDRKSLIVRPGWLMTAYMRPAGFQPPEVFSP
jgi:hypothetical protein